MTVRSHTDVSVLIAAIKKGRGAIRYHRDQKGDDRCWLDDWRVWAVHPTSPATQNTLPSFQEGMKLCRLFYTLRNAETPDDTPLGAIPDENKWDADLDEMDGKALERELERLRAAIGIHRDIVKARPLEIEDDRALYAVLPEKVPADFRLPREDEFLGEARAPKAGCPAFWRSHASCEAPHNPHTWGPCGKS